MSAFKIASVFPQNHIMIKIEGNESPGAGDVIMHMQSQGNEALRISSDSFVWEISGRNFIHFFLES